METHEVNPKQLGLQYEKIMRRLFPNNKSKRNGCDSYLMIRLIDSEMSRHNSENFQKHYGARSITKQTEHLRKNIYVGIDRLKKKVTSENELCDLLDIEEGVEYAQSFRSIMYLLEQLDDFISSNEEQQLHLNALYK